MMNRTGQFFRFLWRDDYGGLRIRLFLINSVIGAIPLLFIIGIGYFWLLGVSREDFELKLQKEAAALSQSLEYFLAEKVSGLRMVSSIYKLEAATDDRTMQSVLQLMKHEFAEIVDVGIIDPSGVKIAYAGPYDLKGKTYADHDWFHEVSVRGLYISEVYMGYRKIPHFAIAVKKQVPGAASFYVWRITIDVEALNKRILSMHLEGEDDAFLVNREGVIQSASRFSGAVLEKSFVKSSMLPTRYSPADLKIIEEKDVTVGYVPVRNSPWTLVIVTKHQRRDKIMELLRKDYTLVYLTLFLITIGLVANYLIAKKIVSRLEASDKEKQAALHQTEHASKLASIGRLAAGVAHEINNPLAIINEKAGLMRDIMNIVPEFTYKDKFVAQISSIHQSVERCRTITHRLLGFARQMDVSLEILDLNLLLKDVVGFLEREMVYRNIQLDLMLDDNLPPLESDRGQLQQVFLNIINNALDAVSDGGRIGVRTGLKDEETLSVSIEDNGHGIPADKLKHVFEPFFSTRERGKGTGLGLSITYGIVKKLGGSIDVQSTVNEGTTFVVDLPRRFVVSTEGGE